MRKMPKNKKLLKIATIVLVIVAGLHFVPFDSRTGYLDNGLANVCIGYSAPINYNYRWITGGVNTWDNDLSHLVAKNPGCAQPVHLRLYLL
jgi:hypothetical protein